MGLINSDSLYHFKSKLDFTISNHWKKLGLSNINDLPIEQLGNYSHHTKTSFGGVLVWDNKKILIIENVLNNLPFEQANFDKILIRRNAKINESTLLKLDATKLIFDGSCSKWYINKLPKTINQTAHVTNRDGALIL